jgi:hypothetical protein
MGELRRRIKNESAESGFLHPEPTYHAIMFAFIRLIKLGRNMGTARQVVVTWKKRINTSYVRQ